MGHYYFPSTSLPTLRLTEPPEMGFFELMDLFQLNLSSQDWQAVKTIRRLVDLYNLCSYWKGESFDPHGNLSEQEIEEALLYGEGFPSYVADFLQRHTTSKERLHHHGALIAQFFNEEIPRARGFLKKYLTFERQWRLVLVGLRAKQLGKDVGKELQYEDPFDPIVAQIIAQRDAKQYEPFEGYEPLKALFLEHQEKPVALQQAMERYRFEAVDLMGEEELFSIGYLLAYMVQLMIVEKWQLVNRAYQR